MVPAYGTAPTALERSVEDYLTSCRARGLSLATLSNSYGFPLRHVFLPWAARESLATPSQVTGRSLERLAVELLDVGGRRGPLSRHSVHTYLRAVNQFLKWAKAEGEAVADNARVALPSRPRSLPEVLSREQIEAMEGAAVSERDRLIVRLLADTGMRVGELVGLRTGDLLTRTRGAYLRLRGKGGRERQVPLMPRLAHRVERYLRQTRPKDSGSNRLFLGLRRSRETGGYEPLTPSGVQQLVRGLGQRSGIPQRVHPHLFRHSFVTWALAQGMNPVQLADIVGHTSLTMIQQVYSHLSPNDAYDAMARVLMARDQPS
ncbi:MAG: tyrosine-type recombinase/integrase [Candidatus Dormibacteria bacterium]